VELNKKGKELSKEKQEKRHAADVEKIKAETGKEPHYLHPWNVIKLELHFGDHKFDYPVEIEEPLKSGMQWELTPEDIPTEDYMDSDMFGKG